MPPIRSLAFKRRLRLVSLILSLGEIILLYSHYIKKRLSYIAILVPFSHQPFFYAECTRVNMRSSCNIKLVSNAKCTSFIYFYIL